MMCYLLYNVVPLLRGRNGIFRDTVRCFIKGDEGRKGDFATRLGAFRYGFGGV